MKFSISQILQTLLFLVIGLVLVYFQIKVLSLTERQQVIDALRSANYFWIALAMLVAVFSHALRARRWTLIINSTNEHVSQSSTFYGVMIGYLVNGFIPRAGEIVRCGVVNRVEKVRFEKLIGTVVAERLFDLLMLILIVLFTLMIQFDFLYQLINEKLFLPFFEKITNSFYQISFFFVLSILLLTSFFFLSRYIFQKTSYGQNLRNKWKAIRENFQVGLTSIIKIKSKSLFLSYSLGMWICYFFISFLIFKSLPESVHLGLDAGLSVLTSGSLALLIPTPGGLGSYHQFVSNTLQLYGISPVIGVSLSWLIWMANFSVMLILGLFSFVLISLKRS